MKKFIQTILFISLILGTLLLYALTVRGIYGNPKASDIKNNLDQATKPLELSPERGRFALTMSLVEDQSFALTQEVADAVYPDVGYYMGRFYIYFTPGISIMAMPLYMLGSHYNLSQVFSFYLSSIFATLSAIFIYIISKRIMHLPTWASLFASLAYAFGSISWSYAITLYQHQATTFFILSAFFAAWYFRGEKRFNFLACLYVWFAYGISILVDYSNAFLFIPVIVYFLLSAFKVRSLSGKVRIAFKPAILISSVIFVLISIGHGYFNHVNFGSWKRLSGGLVGYKTIREEKLFTEAGGQATIKKLEEEKNPVRFFSEQRFPRGLYTLTASIDRGIVLYSPIFLIAIFGIFASLKRASGETATLVGILSVILFLYSSWGDPWGGWAYGPRYLIPAMAVLSMFVSMWISQKRHSILRRLLALILFAYSAAIALLGALTTNAVPPKIEADYLHMKYNFLHNIDFLLANRSGSFIFNQYISHGMTLTEYFLLIYSVIVIVSIIFLFIVPKFEHHEH